MIILFLYIGNDYKGQMLAPGLSCCLFLSRTGKRARTATKTSGDSQDHGKDKRKLSYPCAFRSKLWGMAGTFVLF